MAVVLVPGIRVVAVLATQEASGEEGDEAEARSIHRAADFVRVHVPDEVLVVVVLLQVTREDCVIVTRGLDLGGAAANDLQFVAAAGQRLAHAAAPRSPRGTCG